MQHTRLLAVISFMTFTILTVWGGPVRNSHAFYTQPDGTRFAVHITGDEWTKTRRTDDGCAIVKDPDGWWCYATYNEAGETVCTGCHVGSPVSASVLSDSRILPRRQSHKRATHTGKLRQKVASTTRGTGRTHKSLVIPIQFPDKKFRYTKQDFYNLLNQKGYNGTGCVKDYYTDQFGAGTSFSFDITDIVTVSQPYSYYGKNDMDRNDERPWEMIEEACRLVDAKVNFADYDQDQSDNYGGVRYVDNVYIFYAGESEAEKTEETDLIWPHQYWISEAGIDLTLDGVKIDAYTCSAELSDGSMTGIGTFCHEYGHILGLPDFYDTDFSDVGSEAAGLWYSTSLMDGGSYNNNSATPPNFNCIERMLLGIADPVNLQAGISYTLEPIHKSNRFYRLDSDRKGEYFLFECRSNEGWDRYIRGSGMLAYHIDENETEYIEGWGIESKWDINSINSDPDHQCADLIEADRRGNIATNDLLRDISKIFFPAGNITSLSSASHPDFRYWSGSKPTMKITGMTKDGNNIHFTTSDGSGAPAIQSVTGFSSSTFPDAIFITFMSSIASTGSKAVVEWCKTDSADIQSREVTPDTDGTFACLMTGLESGNTPYDIRITIGNGLPFKRQVMTDKETGASWPYLHMTGQVSIDSGIIAHAVNAADAEEISWYLDGSPADLKNGCLIKPSRSGTLKCVIQWKDGSHDIIIKKFSITGQQ